jgi:hypothetical protein
LQRLRAELFSSPVACQRERPINRVIRIPTKKLSEKTSGSCAIIDITADVTSQLADKEIARGQVRLFLSVPSLCSS